MNLHLQVDRVGASRGDTPSKLASTALELSALNRTCGPAGKMSSVTIAAAHHRKTRMAVHVEIGMDGEAREGLRDEWLAAEQEAASALLALSERLFVSPALHDGLRGSAPFQHWRSCSERVRRLKEEFDASAHDT